MKQARCGKSSSFLPAAVAAALLSASALGCATSGQRASGSERLPVVAGIWEGYSQDKVQEGLGSGDTRIQRQAWHLRQSGSAISGFYVAELTMVSGDGRPYLCSREPRFSTLIRFDVRGRVEAAGIRIEEVGDALAKGPCRPVFRSPTHFKAELKGDVLTLSDGSHRVALQRRASKEQGPTKQLLAFERPDNSWVGEPSFPTLDRERHGKVSATSGEGDAIEVGGTWVWEHRGRVPGGDEKQEREEWHLEQEGTRLSGYYDRAIRQVSNDGQAYRCSNALDFKVITRYHLAGEVKGNKIVIYERSFEILEASPCDTGQRRLDAYQGEAQLDELKLLWGVGTQVLRRERSDIPSQRF